MKAASDDHKAVKDNRTISMLWYFWPTAVAFQISPGMLGDLIMRSELRPKINLRLTWLNNLGLCEETEAHLTHRATLRSELGSF